MKFNVSGKRKIKKLEKNFKGSRRIVRDETARVIEELAGIAERGIKAGITMGPTRAIDTGFMRSSVTTLSRTKTKAEIGPTADYSIYVHEGTRFMRSRPFIPAGWDMVQSDVEAALKGTGVRITTSLVKGV